MADRSMKRYRNFSGRIGLRSGDMQLSCSGCFSAMVGLYRSLLFLGLVSIALPVVAAGPLRINTGFTPPVSGLLEQIMIEAFKRVDVEMSFYELPAERSLKLVVSGVDDGDCCRIPRAIRRDYPGLIRVPESVYVARFSAFAKRPVPEVLSWNDLKPYNVATVTGWKIIVNNLRRVSPATTHVVDHPQSMFEMLQRDRIDIASFGYLSGLWRLKQQGLVGESLFLRKLVLGIQAQASGKYLTRPFMPTAPRRPAYVA
ncbi:hypothetical protein [Candidatus Reidiella endopervernicosa]|uniref:Transporter substrate-binding domain-containing protein n=1 Tax=Candidatus Reidiella endopervernicosa TaxID=2738883 RepID=A0A6N0HU69_9GAMM|nr:hypothetical protein [Candidatus Reidiella endopervernicosa]QKQ25944.1 hypothetical protein HUE57_06345 [Candidatus Reidiella endopervernicosa]